MKKVLTLILFILVSISLIACSSNKTGSESITNNNNSSNDNDTTQSDTSNKEYEGVDVLRAVYNKENDSQYYKITLPTDEGYYVVHGYGSIALDGTWVFGGGTKVNETIECNSVEDIYNAFQHKWEDAVLYMLHDGSYSDAKFTVESSEMKEINGFTMVRYVGTLTYNKIDYQTAQVSSFARYFVAYGTQLSEGGYLYWVVFDNSDDQSFKQRVISNADSMAKSLKETDIFNN